MLTFYQELIETTSQILIAQGFDPKEVERAARAVVEGIRENFSGLMIYTPKRSEALKTRDAEIRRLFFDKGSSCESLARSYGLTVRQIYRILR